MAAVDEPEVCDVLVASKDGTAGVKGERLPHPRDVEVVPVEGGAQPGRHREAQQGEDCGATSLHLAQVEEERGHPVLDHHRLFRLEAVEVVHVGLVVTSNAV